MSRVAVFVDAGYFWVQCSNILFGSPNSRAHIDLDIIKLRTELKKIITEECKDIPLLRIYWYDGLGVNGKPSAINHDLNLLDDFKLRYGTLNSEKKQKGVDGLIIADLIGLAQNKSIISAVLISGDADLAPGVAAAQTLGIRVHRLEMHNQDASSHTLRAEVDKNRLWDENNIKTFIKVASQTCLPSKAETTSEGISLAYNYDLKKIAKDFLRESQSDLVPTSSNFPKKFDVRLLGYARKCAGKKLESNEIYQLRNYIRIELGLDIIS